MRKQTLIAIVTASAFVFTALPFLARTVPGREHDTQIQAQREWPREERTFQAPRRGPADGHVDLSGVWGYAGYTSDIAKDYDVGELPMTPFGDKLFKERQANEGTEDPEARCLPTGVPRRDPYPSKILQLPNLVGDFVRRQSAQLPADLPEPRSSQGSESDMVGRFGRQMGRR